MRMRMGFEGEMEDTIERVIPGVIIMRLVRAGG